MGDLVPGGCAGSIRGKSLTGMAVYYQLRKLIECFSDSTTAMVRIDWLIKIGYLDFIKSVVSCQLR